MLVRLHPGSEIILSDLADTFGFTFECKSQSFNDRGQLQYCYQVSEMSYARKADLDNYINQAKVGTSYGRASVLYSLYACGYLTVTDIEYPTYYDWKKKHGDGVSLDHRLPRYWFPNLTFDCTNWQPLSIADNQNKGDDFRDEGVERLEWLSTKLADIKSKYLE